MTAADAQWRLDRAKDLIREWMPAGKAAETLALLDAGAVSYPGFPPHSWGWPARAVDAWNEWVAAEKAAKR